MTIKQQRAVSRHKQREAEKRRQRAAEKKDAAAPQFPKRIVRPQAAWEYLEAWLSSQGSVLDFQNSGQIPTRADAATTPAVKDDTAAAPFVAAIKTVSAWPTSSKIAQMQTTVGTELSDVVSGQASAASAAAATATAIQSDIKAGGGDC